MFVQKIVPYAIFPQTDCIILIVICYFTNICYTNIVSTMPFVHVTFIIANANPAGNKHIFIAGGGGW
jgi:hypothetical protein